MFKAFIFENRTVLEIMWKNTVDPGRPHIKIWRMRIACWILKAKNTLSEYATLIAFQLQQWSHKRNSMLRYSTLPVLFYYDEI